TRTSTGPPSRGRGSSARAASTARTSASRSGSTTSTATVRGWLGAPVVFTATASPTGATAGPVHGLRGAGPVERDAPVEDAGRPRGHDLPNREKPRQGGAAVSLQVPVLGGRTEHLWGGCPIRAYPLSPIAPTSARAVGWGRVRPTPPGSQVVAPAPPGRRVLRPGQDDHRHLLGVR